MQEQPIGRREWVRLGVASTLLAACGESAGLDRAGALDAGVDAAGPAKGESPRRDAAAPRDDAAAPRSDATVSVGPSVERAWPDTIARDADLVDVHAGFLPSSFLKAAEAADAKPEDRPEWPSWSLAGHLRLMDQAGIRVSMLSLAATVDFGDRNATIRAINDEAAQLVATSPQRLRFYATLPLHDVDAAVAEWRRVRGQPGCVGATLGTHSEGMYLGDARFDPLWRELHDAKALVLLQAVAPPSWHTVDGGEPWSTCELYFESVRALMSMFENQVLTRHPGVRVVVPYCGGALPVVLDRMRTFGIAGYGLDPLSINAELACLWFDSAGTPFPTQLPALAGQVSQARILFGSDSTRAALESIHAQVVSLEQTVSPTDASWRATLVKNSTALLP